MLNLMPAMEDETEVKTNVHLPQVRELLVSPLKSGTTYLTPYDLRITSFKKNLKTYLFNQAFTS